MNSQIGQLKCFSEVDAASDPAFHAACLTRIAGLDSTLRYKLTSFEMQRLAPGQRVLDAGCGVGTDLVELARRVAPGGEVVGVDLSERLLTSARESVKRENIENASIWVAKQDFRRLGLLDGYFDAVRIDRCLQHVTDGASVIRELARVLKPGGTLVAVDPDWPTLRIAHCDPAATGAILQAYRRHYKGAEQALHLREYFLKAGLTDVQVDGDVLVLDSLSQADSIFEFCSCAEGLVGGLLTREQLDGWMDELRRRDREGEFLLSLTRLIIAGTKRYSGHQ